MISALHLRAIGRHAAWLVCGVVGCTGAIGDGAGSIASGGPPGSSNPSAPDAASPGSPGGSQAFACTSGGTPEPGPSPMLMLSRVQYLNTLQGLFGTIPDLSAALGADTTYQATYGLVQPNVDLAGLGSYQAAAEAVAAAAVASPATLGAIAPCAAGADQRGCAQTFVQSFGALAYRAPITDPADIARHMALYDVGASTSHAHGIEMVLRGILQAPRFLYRIESGTTEQVGPDAVKLSNFEVAARLSYVLWNTLPDPPLTQAAQSGALATPDAVVAQLTRMLQDPKGQTLLRGFLEGLVELPGLSAIMKDPTLYPEWSANGTTLPASMEGQARAFFDDVLANQGGQVASLLTSSTVFVNKDLASYYGVTGGDIFQPQKLPTGKASGLLTLPALLTLMAKPDQSWPIYRGKFVRENLLCQILPTPPPNIPKPPDVQPGVSTRARLTEHETNPSCSGCHQLMDPIGFGFEAYDAIGRFRTTDGNQPVDTTGQVVQSDDVNGPFNGVAELAGKLASSAQVRQCFARQWFRFAMSRFEQTPDGCSMKSILDKFEAASASLNVLPQALVQSDAFLYRRPLDSQVSP